MALPEPAWWYAERSLQADVLAPVGTLYGRIARSRYEATKPYRSRLPVVCVGNLTAGGTGKTPLAIALASLIERHGRKPWFLSRGYGGRLSGPARVDPEVHTAADVGDEPLLLARYAPVVIARHRAVGVAWIEATAGQDAAIIMDDGLQNPSVAKNLTIALVDRRRGIGNGMVIPAGPLRAPLEFQTPLADLIVTTGDSEAVTAPSIKFLLDLTDVDVLAATTRGVDAGWLDGQTVLAYAGIANPARFFTLLAKLGAKVIAERAFLDHHAFTEQEAAALVHEANELRATLVTTEKDLVRLSIESGALGELKRQSRILAIRPTFDDEAQAVLDRMLSDALNR